MTQRRFSNFPGSSEAVLELPEIKSASDAIRNIDVLPKPHLSSVHREGKSIQDLLDCLSLALGFQLSYVKLEAALFDLLERFGVTYKWSFQLMLFLMFWKAL
ncbi:callose synthase 7-like [Lolium rigidum]|uniref:callose synthase 7-like n=1 Tax=Lolium rigidum TaxID=89674 RepID=UPI001F5D8BC4|nr:callose synthase 7-like [Lolium rigidum]